jgi:hypothetical protein
MADRIVGITRTSLWQAWKEVRKILPKSSRRDVVDYLEYDIDPEKWIAVLLSDIERGTYEPAAPVRFELAKAKGFNRRMTFPRVPDLVLYRAVVDCIFERVRRKEHQHVYFLQDALAEAKKVAVAQAKQKMDELLSPYAPISKRRFYAWLRFDQYRKLLILDKIYPYIVTTDITNFFDSVLYGRVAAALHGLSAPPEIVGLLFFLLERFSIREAYSESPRIGLPVDEFDCSRKLAHMILFSHDDRMVSLVGEEGYVRWMDDQNFGTKSKADALAILAEVDRSLRRLHLTANSSKSRILTLKQARRHFHLDINARLGQLDGKPYGTALQKQKRAGEIENLWFQARKYEGVGEWGKVLKRIYRLAGRSRSGLLRRRAVNDVLANPDLVERVADYMRATGSVPDFLRFAERLWTHPEQAYPSVNLSLCEALLRLEPDAKSAQTIRQVGSALLSGTYPISNAAECAGVAPLILLRFGDRRSLPLLRRTFDELIDKRSSEVVRASAVVFASFGRGEFQAVRRAASRLLRGNLAEMVRFVERVLKYEEVPGSYKARINPRMDSVRNIKYVDMRSVVAARLLALNDRPKVRAFLRAKIVELSQRQGVSVYDRRLLNRLIKVS